MDSREEAKKKMPTNRDQDAVERKVNLDLHESLKGLPVEQLKTQSQVDAWFKDDTQDY